MKEFMEYLDGTKNDEEFSSNHPKIQCIQEILIEHFEKHGEDTRAMVFTEYRESVDQIVKTLEPFSPLIKPSQFIGQTKKSGKKGMSQKEQEEIINRFKKGKLNCLVATCIAEEGLDIGEVDLIVCFDAQASPIRMIQRMGRTGRKRNGKCIILTTSDESEEKIMESFQGRKDKMNTLITKSNNFTFYDNVPRLIPEDLDDPVPVESKLIIEDDDIKDKDDEDEDENKSTKKKKKGSSKKRKREDADDDDGERGTSTSTTTAGTTSSSSVTKTPGSSKKNSNSSKDTEWLTLLQEQTYRNLYQLNKEEEKLLNQQQQYYKRPTQNHKMVSDRYYDHIR
eukprot:TRINITY_DN3569_c0_g2_i2.p1 TRINITY_DN3569_c0_g2~~TRINITY_DN3569_c0_g2_i2.p1  ORF type:complete len:353 (+),score=111.64 TRINITY_DN3569_c0_g2_i2:47-1060(+)